MGAPADDRAAQEQAALRRVATLVAGGAAPEEVFAAIAAEAAQARVELRSYAEEQAALRRVATLVASGAAPEEVFAAVAAEAGRMLGADLTAVTRYEPGDMLTVLGAWRSAGTVMPFTASRARIVAAADEARRRIERDLHDGAQQRLVTLALRLREAQAAASEGTDALVARLDEVADGLEAAVEELREIARGIHPAVLARGGLRPALRALARRSPVPVDLRVQVAGRLPDPVEIAAYYVVAEALTNAARHAGATAAHIEVVAEATMLRVSVRDDGRGGADVDFGSGLTGLRDRVEALRGQVTLYSPPGAGTVLEVGIPLGPGPGRG